MHLPFTMPDDDQNGMSKEALVIIDEEPFSQECLVQAIRSAFPGRLVLGVSAADELYRVGETTVGLVLLKIHTHPISGGELANETKAIHEHCPDAPIVVLSVCMNAGDIEAAMDSGVSGIIPMTTSFKIAVAALQLVMVGGTYYPRFGNGDLHAANGDRNLGGLLPGAHEPFILSHAAAGSYLTIMGHAEETTRPDSNEANTIFTARELDVLEALQKGWSNKWIAHSLHISENTIKVHIQRIMRKLHVTNRTEAVVRHRQLNGLR
jgi:DNA-binding NarL/FixJ family response regulator